MTLQTHLLSLIKHYEIRTCEMLLDSDIYMNYSDPYNFRYKETVAAYNTEQSRQISQSMTIQLKLMINPYLKQICIYYISGIRY